MELSEHWEPPDPQKLFISSHRVAEELGISLERAYGVSYSLGRFYYGDGHSFRVSLASLHALKELLEQDLDLGDACAMMTHFGDEPPPDDLTRMQAQHIAWLGTRRRRRRTETPTKSAVHATANLNNRYPPEALEPAPETHGDPRSPSNVPREDAGCDD